MTITAGTTLHWLANGVDYMTSDIGLSGVSTVSQRGQSFVLTDSILEANRDRTGFSIFEIADKPEEQERRHGRQLLGVGPAPADLGHWTPGTVEFDLARDEARRLAWLEPTATGQQEALREVERVFGRTPSGQKSVEILGDVERDAELRRAGLR